MSRKPGKKNQRPKSKNQVKHEIRQIIRGADEDSGPDAPPDDYNEPVDEMDWWDETKDWPEAALEGSVFEALQALIDIDADKPDTVDRALRALKKVRDLHGEG